MWEDYAKKIGVGVQSLTQAQRVEAEYQGILQETGAQVGDLAKLSGGLAGAQAQAEMQTVQLSRAFGESMTPIVGVGTELKTGVLAVLTEITSAAPGTAAGFTTAATALTGMVSASAGLATMKKLLEGIGLTMSALKPLALIAAVLGVAVGAYTAYRKSVEEAAKAEEERIQKNKDDVSAQKKSVDRLDELAARYRELSRKQKLTYDDQRELAGIQDELSDAYGLTAENLDGLTKSTKEYNDALDGAKKKQMDELLAYQKKASQDALQKTYTKESVEAYEEMAKACTELKEAQEALDSGSYADNGISEENARQRVKDAQDWAAEAYEALKPFESLYADWYNAAVDELITAAQIRGETVDAALLETLRGLFTIDLSAFGGDRGAGEKYVDDVAAGIIEACADPAMSEALAVMQEVMSRAMQGIAPSEDDMNAVAGAWGKLTGAGSPLKAYCEQLAPAGKDADEFANKLIGSIAPIDLYTTSLDKAKSGLKNQADAALENADALADLEKEFDWTNATTEEAEAQAKKLIRASKALDTQYKDLAKDAAILEKGQAALNKAKDDASSMSEQEQRDLQAVSDLVGVSADDLDELGAAVNQNAKDMQTQLGACNQKAELLASGLAIVLRNKNISGSIKIEAASALNVLSLMISGLAAIANFFKLKFDAPDDHRGGGGGGKKDTAEEAARAAEEARRERIQKDYEEIAHRRHMNEITLEQELSMLAAIRDNHKLNAEEIMEWEEKIFDLKEELRDRDTEAMEAQRDRDAESLDALSDGVMDALAARYEAMRDAELERLDASREAWEKWRDDSVRAIEDQIAALDKLADTEDREKQDAEELRKIEKLRRDVAFEQDEYNRMKLQQQLDAAMESREERLRKLALQEQKEALRGEIDKIKGQADGKLSAIDQEQEKLEAAYDERLKAASLRAEAERMIMEKNQMEMLALLRDFAPEYDAIGKSMGERLLEGFTEKVGGVAGWFETFNGWVSQLQEQMAQVALAGADTLYDSYAKQAKQVKQQAKGAVTVTQTVNFNEPVESPSRTARRLEEVNEALGRLVG